MFACFTCRWLAARAAGFSSLHVHTNRRFHAPAHSPTLLGVMLSALLGKLGNKTLDMELHLPGIAEKAR